LLPGIQPFLDFERHITTSSRTRTAQARLGHVSLAATNVYAEVDLERKAKALANCEVDGEASGKPRREVAGLIDFLRTLRLDRLCGVRSVPRSTERAGAQADAT
jgi:hypothetical protein